MEKANQKRRKGGAEKERDRKKKKLTDSASKCQNLLHLFQNADTRCDQREEGNESVPGPSAVEKSDNQSEVGPANDQEQVLPATEDATWSSRKGNFPE